MPASRPSMNAELAALRQIVEEQGRRIAELEAAKSVGGKVLAASKAGNAERARLAAARALRLAPMAGALGWSDSGRRLSDAALLDLVRQASPDPDASIPSRATARRAVESLLGPARRGEAWSAASRETAQRARLEIVRGRAFHVPHPANGISKRA